MKQIFYFQIIYLIKENISQEDLQFLISLKEDNKNVSANQSKLFGSNIPFHEKRVSWPNTENLYSMAGEKEFDIVSAFLNNNIETVNRRTDSNEVSINLKC